MNPILAFTKLIRLPNLLIIALTQYAIRYAVMEPMLTSGGSELLLSSLHFFLLSLSTVMIAASGYIINDYFDVKIDRINRPQQIIIGKYVKRRVAMGAHLVINIIAISIAAYLAYQMENWQLLFIQLGSAGALWYYSILFKKQVLIGNVIVALLAALVPFVAGLYELILQHVYVESTVNQLLFLHEEFTPFEEVLQPFLVVLSDIMIWIIGFSFFAFISTLIREIIKDIEDYAGDKKYASNTLVVVYGKSAGKRTAQFFAIIMMGLIAYLQYLKLIEKDMTTFIYFLFAIQIPLAYVVFQLHLAKEKAKYHQLSSYMKLIMLSGIIYTSLIYYTLTV